MYSEVGVFGTTVFKYGKVYHVDLGDRGMVTEVPKKVRNLDERLGLDIFPKVVRS